MLKGQIHKGEKMQKKHQEEKTENQIRLKLSRIAVTFIVLLLSIGFIFKFCYHKVPNGYVGVVYSLNGGVEETILGQGARLMSPLKNVINFPTTQQQLILSNDPNDYTDTRIPYRDNSINATTNNGGALKLNVQMNYTFDTSRIVELYKTFNTNGESIVYSKLSNEIISLIKEVITRYEVMDVYATKRTEVNAALTDKISVVMSEKYGIMVSDVSIIDAIPSDEVKAKIDAKVQANEEKEKALLDAETAQAEADKNRIIAQGQADVKMIEAQAEAAANKLLAESMTPELIEMKEAEANMKLADAHLKHGFVTIQGSSTPIVDTRR